MRGYASHSLVVSLQIILFFILTTWQCLQKDIVRPSRMPRYFVELLCSRTGPCHVTLSCLCDSLFRRWKAQNWIFEDMVGFVKRIETVQISFQFCFQVDLWCTGSVIHKVQSVYLSTGRSYKYCIRLVQKHFLEDFFEFSVGFVSRQSFVILFSLVTNCR